MTRKGLDRDHMIQNLADAGCSENEIAELMKAIDVGDDKTLERLIEAHRKNLLEQYHNSKRCIDCIDYFSYQLKRQWGK